MSKKVLSAGEFWMSYTAYVKGPDSFYTSICETGEKRLKVALEEGGYEVTFVSNHLAGGEFPFTVEELKKYDAVILSDIGANTLLLPSVTSIRSERKSDGCNPIRGHVLNGGALMMVGGYLTFSDVDTKGKWHNTTAQQVLPVEVLTVDNRTKYCEGTTPATVAEHEALNGIPRKFPEALGYNKTTVKSKAIMAVMVDDNPFIAFGVCREGKSAVVTTDCAPHWTPPGFCEWEYYNRM